MEINEIKNIEVLSVIGHLIISNNSIHNYQLRYIEGYMESYDIAENYWIIDDIFYKKETAISCEESIEYFKKESKEVQNDLIEHLIIIAKLDGILDRYEKEFLSAFYPSYKKIECDLKEAFDQIITLFQEEDKKKRDKLDLERIRLEEVVGYINRIRKVFNDSNLESKEYVEIRDNLLDYSKLKEISSQDFQFIEPISKEILLKSKELYDSLSRDIEIMKLKSDIDKEITEDLDKGLNVFSEKIIAKIENMDRELSKKENTLNNFTISLVGKTKVGKSTLHTVLTGEGKEAIGVGKQGTTKYNRVYQWGNLRIVDTPGVESSKADGKADEEVAMEIITESDIICIVLTDDQIGTSLFDLIDKIVTRNKSVIVILNHKANIIHPIRYKDFIKNSRNWITDKGTEGIEGHLNRFDNGIVSKGHGDKVQRYPVFLGAALLAMEDKYKEDKVNLIDGSNIDAFKTGLKNEIQNNGIKLKSQTMLDDSGKILKEVRNDLISVENDLKNIMGKLKKSKDAAFRKIRKEQKSLLEDINNIVRQSFASLKNDYAREFAVENYNEDNLDERWDKFIKEKKFSDNVNNSIELALINFNNNVKDIIEDMSDDIQVGIDTSISIGTMDLGFINIDFQKIFKRLAGLGKIAGAFALLFNSIIGPVGIAIGLVSSAVEWLASKFRSKEKKKLEAINKLEKKLIKAIDDSEEVALEKISLDVKNTITEELDKFKDMTETQMKELEKNKNLLYGIIELYNTKIIFIEERYDERLKELVEV